MMKNKIKKITFLCVLLALTLVLSAMLYSCDKPDIYTLIENILQNKNPNPKATNIVYSFTSDLNIKIKKDYLREIELLPDFGKQNDQLDAVPGELKFKVDGKVISSDFIINFTLVLPDKESQDIKTAIRKSGDFLYVELNDVSRVILDLLTSTGFLDSPVKTLFDSFVEYDDGSVLCFDLNGFDLKYFDEYMKETEKIFTVKSNVKYDFTYKAKNLDASATDETKVLYFNDIKNKINKELLKLPDYRYIELYAVIGPDEDNNNYLNILAKRKNGEKKILEKVKLDCNLSKVRKDADSLLSENIIPMRYLLELLGETVGWNADKKQAFITKNDKQIFFDGTVKNSTTYISLLQIMLNTDYLIKSTVVDDYIEFVITRK